MGLYVLQACEYYSHAFELDPEDESALLNRAITRALLRKVPEALQDFSLALKLNPDSAHVHFNRANLYCSLRKYTPAEKDFTQGTVYILQSVFQGGEGGGGGGGPHRFFGLFLSPYQISFNPKVKTKGVLKKLL